ncbi:MAG TPA: crosslink repair DNA glycosylase YcaQ family protein [Polyangiaceae bacterium]|nr:crosslink repair DNA glycosylase YcaQ family protein [Polyangiaceae bacterium]
MSDVSLKRLRSYAVRRTLFAPTTLRRALKRLGYVQADPIRAPARAQDLVLRLRVKDYRAGDLERRYPELDIEEDFFVNYGFILREHYRLMHPRAGTQRWSSAKNALARAVLEFVHESGAVHPRDVEQRFGHGRVVNYWGGTSNATTRLLDGMHYRGLLRVARRERGIRVYSAQDPREKLTDPALQRLRMDALIDVLVSLYAPLPRVTLLWLVRRLRYANPQWTRQLGLALARTEARLNHAQIDGVNWYWPAHESIKAGSSDLDRVRLLAPFDPLVWDRFRFERLWGWAYRFEAYTPVPKRKLGYYALPLLWRDRVIGWANVTTAAGELDCRLGFVGARPKQRSFERALEAELSELQAFLRPRVTSASRI